MTKRMMTERDFSLLLALRDVAWGLHDQIDAICDAVGDLVGARGEVDDVTDLILNRGDVDDFLKGLGIEVVKNGVEPASDSEPAKEEPNGTHI